ncbi:MAG: hypothetical protein ACRCTZ_16980 [Sarcina sp.]
MIDIGLEEEIQEMNDVISQIGAEKMKLAEEEFINRMKKQSTQYKYFVSYGLYNEKGEFKLIDNGIFFVDDKVVDEITMFKLDQMVTYFVKPEGDSFVKLISWSLLGEPIGTVE